MNAPVPAPGKPEHNFPALLLRRTWRLAACSKGLPLFFVHLLEDLVLHREIGDDPFESGVFLFQGPQPAGLAHIHPTILALPGVIGGFADVVLGAHRFDGATTIAFPKDCDDLLFTESTSFHLFCFC